MSSEAGETSWVRSLRQPDSPAAARYMSIVYEELRRLAVWHLSGERRDHTLTPTALVHEAFIRLVDAAAAQHLDRVHFLAFASKIMRRVLVDHARSHDAAKRGGGRCRITLHGDVAVTAGPEIDFLALDETLERLAALDERQAAIVELRFFGGLTVEEVAEILGVSKRLVEGEWALARAWLRRELANTHEK